MHPQSGLRSKSVWTYLALIAMGYAFAVIEAQAATALPVTEAAAVEEATNFERGRQWVEAIDLYEKSLKEWPDNATLKAGLRRTRIQFSVDRRYADKSYTDGLTKASLDDALVYLDDTLLKVRQYYVDTVTPTAFVAHGTESLYFALSNEKFIAANSPNASARSVASLRSILRDRYWNKSCGSMEEARRIVAEVARVSNQELRIAPGAVVMEYVFGGCNSLDEYSSFLTPGRLNDLYSNIEGEFVGIGIEMKAEAGKGMLLLNVISESPAEEGGAAPGDFIVAIDGVNCLNMSTEESAQLLQGAPDSTVTLSLKNPRNDQVRQAQLRRRAVKVKSIPIVRMVDQANGIAYIKMTGFQKNSAAELDAALVELKAQGMQSLIWDLRGNPGGLLNAAVEVLDRFLDDGMIVSTKGRTPDQNWKYAATRGNDWHIPLVVLVDGDSASASEIVAGAIHDQGRGVLVGRKTYGKWSVQSILPGRSSTGFRLTTAKFYSPNGNTYGKIGVEPDILVKVDEKQFVGYRGLRNEDPQDDQDILAGMNALRQQTARR